jgi:hypothetical protein
LHTTFLTKFHPFFILLTRSQPITLPIHLTLPLPPLDPGPPVQNHHNYSLPCLLRTNLNAKIEPTLLVHPSHQTPPPRHPHLPPSIPREQPASIISLLLKSVQYLLLCIPIKNLNFQQFEKHSRLFGMGPFSAFGPASHVDK